MNDTPAPEIRRWRGIRSILRPIRQRTAWFALVGEEQSLRVQQTQQVREDVIALRNEFEALRAEIVALRAETPGVATMLQQQRVRTDALLDEVWRRAEGTIAMNTAVVQRHEAEIARITRENAALLRLAAQPQRVLSGEGDIDSVRLPEAAARDRITDDALFAELERGSREDVMDKFARYIAHFRGRTPILDLGCGRGEFLELGEWTGLSAYGVDLDETSVAGATARGLDARQEDIYEHLAALPEGSLGGVFSSQVVEHLDPARMGELLRLIARALRPGGVVVLETPNPATVAIHVHSFWRDPTHLRPVPAPWLAYLARTAGFVVEAVVYANPLPDSDRLRHVEAPDALEAETLVKGVNQLVDQLNDLLYGHQDYAIVAVKPQ